jgi:hypothetical protein
MTGELGSPSAGGIRRRGLEREPFGRPVLPGPEVNRPRASCPSAMAADNIP